MATPTNSNNYPIQGGASQPVTIMNPDDISSGGGGGGGDASAANQQTQITAEQAIQATAGATSGVAVVTDANGTLQQYLRGIVKLLITAGTLVLGAGSAIIGKVGIDQTTPGTTNKVFVTDISDAEYETVAASQTAQVLGGTGAIGDYIMGILVVPATTSPGNVILLDNATSITVFTGGASSVTNLVPFLIPLNAKSVSGAWKITTGANVSVIASGNFSA